MRVLMKLLQEMRYLAFKKEVTCFSNGKEVF